MWGSGISVHKVQVVGCRVWGSHVLRFCLWGYRNGFIIGSGLLRGFLFLEICLEIRSTIFCSRISVDDPKASSSSSGLTEPI